MNRIISLLIICFVLILSNCNIDNNSNSESEKIILPNGRVLSAEETKKLKSLENDALSIKAKYEDEKGNISEENMEALKTELKNLINDEMGPGYDDLAGIKICTTKNNSRTLATHFGNFQENGGSHPVYISYEAGYLWLIWWAQSYFTVYMWYTPAGYSSFSFRPDSLSVKVKDDVTDTTRELTYGPYGEKKLNWKNATYEIGTPFSDISIEAIMNNAWSTTIWGNDKWWSTSIKSASYKITFNKANYSGITGFSCSFSR